MPNDPWNIFVFLFGSEFFDEIWASSRDILSEIGSPSDRTKLTASYLDFQPFPHGEAAFVEKNPMKSLAMYFEWESK